MSFVPLSRKLSDKAVPSVAVFGSVKNFRFSTSGAVQKAFQTRLQVLGKNPEGGLSFFLKLRPEKSEVDGVSRQLFTFP